MHTWKIILKNFLSLASAELLSKVIAFFTTIYLARVITPDGFGIIGFATAFVSYFILFLDLGMNPISIKKIAQDQKVISEYVDNILSIRILISIVVYLILLLIVFNIEISSIQKTAILLLGLNLFVQSLTLDFVFQALEKINFLSLRTITMSILNLIFVLILVRGISDIIYAIIIFVSTNLLTSIWMLVKYTQILKKYKWKLDFNFIKKLLGESYPLAISAFMISIYYNLDMLMIGVIKTETEVGIYNAVYRIFLVGILPLGVIVKIFFPLLSKVQMKNELIDSLKKYAIMLFSMGLFISVFVYYFSSQIIKLLFGSIYISGNFALKILALNLLLIVINTFIVNPLIVWGKQSHISIAVTIGAIINIVLNLILIPKYSFNGAAFATLSAEVCVLLVILFPFINYLRRM